MKSSVLNPKLYNMLIRRFGSVTIHNNGDVAQLNISKVRPNIGVIKSRTVPAVNVAHGEYYAVNCPYCNDSRQRLWINYLYGETLYGLSLKHVLHCYNEQCNMSKFADELKPYLNKQLTQPVKISKVKAEAQEIKEIELPDGCVSLLDLPEKHHAIKYLKNRYFTPEECSNFGVMYCDFSFSEYRDFLNDRLVFPIYLEGKLVGYQTRVLDSKTPKKYKYWILKNFKKTCTFFGMFLFDDIQDIYIVEGVFDAIRLGKGAFCIFGKKISQEQINLIKKYYSTNNIYVLLDDDATQDSYRLKDDMINSGCLNNITVVPMVTKDPADTALWELQNHINNYRADNHYTKNKK